MDYDKSRKLNLTMLTDFYEITMANGYFEAGLNEYTAYFDMFFRKVPDNGSFAIMAGLQQVIDYLSELKFSEDDIEYLRGRNCFSEKFLEYLRDFRFECDVWAVPEGTPVFPHEPLITVRGPVVQAQFVETMILLLINHQSLIATKANRIVRAADGRGIMEFGTRRAHGASAAVYGARAAYIGGCAGTACAIADIDHGIPALGTMAHSWIQMFPSEYEAFRKYAELYPDNCVLLVDTYDVLGSGVPEAIRVFKEMKPEKTGIRIDSGDIVRLTVQARKMLDEAGLNDCSIVVSNSLDEYIIKDVLEKGACIDSFGVGERLITAKSESVFGGVYKLSALEKDGVMIPKIKISENSEKITYPGFKSVYRLYDRNTGKAMYDVVTLAEEEVPECDGFEAKDLRVKVFGNGRLLYKSPDINQIKKYCAEQIGTLPMEMLEFDNPQTYQVKLSDRLDELRQNMINEHMDK